MSVWRFSTLYIATALENYTGNTFPYNIYCIWNERLSEKRFSSLVLFRIHLFSRVDIHSLYGGSFYVWASELCSLYRGSLPYILPVTLVGLKKYRSLYRGSSNRVYTVVRCNSNCHAITTPTLFIINEVSCTTGSTCIKVANPKNGRAMQLGFFLQLRCQPRVFLQPEPTRIATGNLGNPSYMCRDNKWVSRNDFSLF